MKQSYRYHLAVGFHYPRVVGERGITIGGHTFPKGVSQVKHCPHLWSYPTASPFADDSWCSPLG